MFVKSAVTLRNASVLQNSCETTLIRLMEDWKEALDNSNVVGISSTDLSKAFDTLHPPVL